MPTIEDQIATKLAEIEAIKSTRKVVCNTDNGRGFNLAGLNAEIAQLNTDILTLRSQQIDCALFKDTSLSLRLDATVPSLYGTNRKFAEDMKEAGLSSVALSDVTIASLSYGTLQMTVADDSDVVATEKLAQFAFGNGATIDVGTVMSTMLNDEKIAEDHRAKANRQKSIIASLLIGDGAQITPLRPKVAVPTFSATTGTNVKVTLHFTVTAIELQSIVGKPDVKITWNDGSPKEPATLIGITNDPTSYNRTYEVSIDHTYASKNDSVYNVIIVASNEAGSDSLDFLIIVKDEVARMAFPSPTP
jgi:hypothetical protein